MMRDWGAKVTKSKQNLWQINPLPHGYYLQPALRSVGRVNSEEEREMVEV
jgi:hypothetical protein